jgi:ribonuclease Z
MRYKGRKILIDCGEGTQVAMRILKWGFKSIDMILISHGHGDHILGLPGLLSTMGNSERREPVYIMGPKGIGNIIKGLLLAVPYLPYDIYLLEADEASVAVNFSEKGVELGNVDEKSKLSKDLIISTLELDHSAPCIGYSFYIPRKPKFNVEKAIKYGLPKNLWKSLQKGETVTYNGKVIKPEMVLDEEREGIKVSYITDTRPVEGIADFIKNSHLFICEGTYGDDEDLKKAVENKHMTFSEAAHLAYEGNVRELILTHFSPAMDEPQVFLPNATCIFPNTTIGFDGLIRTLKFSDQ